MTFVLIISVVSIFSWQLFGISATASNHSNNWAVIVSSSRFWFNYRHAANALTFYHLVRQNGIPDSHIILMLSDDIPCNNRNRYPASVFNNVGHEIDLYGPDVEVDYRGYDVTVQRFLRLLQDRWESATVAPSRRLRTTPDSNVFVYLTGHGGDGFLKFQDAEELSAEDFGDSIAQMYTKKRYREMFVIVETCQAASMCNSIRSPNVVCFASSLVGQSSYSHHFDLAIGVSVIDRFTYESLAYLKKGLKGTLKDLYQQYTYGKLHSDVAHVIRPGIRRGDLGNYNLVDFLGATKKAHPLPLVLHTHIQEGPDILPSARPMDPSKQQDRAPLSALSRREPRVVTPRPSLIPPWVMLCILLGILGCCMWPTKSSEKEE